MTGLTFVFNALVSDQYTVTGIGKQKNVLGTLF